MRPINRMSLRLRDIRMLKCKKSIKYLTLVGCYPLYQNSQNCKIILIFFTVFAVKYTYFMNLNILRGQKYTEYKMWSQILLHHPWISAYFKEMVIARNCYCARHYGTIAKQMFLIMSQLDDSFCMKYPFLYHNHYVRIWEVWWCFYNTIQYSFLV